MNQLFALYLVLCNGTVGTEDQHCNDYFISGPVTVEECATAITEQETRNNLGAFECRRLRKPGDDWHQPESK